MRNITMVTEFTIVGFTGDPGLQIFLFIFLLMTYIVTIIGNAAMLVVIFIDQQLHTPMYFFLWNLSLVETLNISNIIPLTLVQIFLAHKSVSVPYCITQCFFFFYLATNLFYLLPIMSFDRYVAICNPLRYTTIMSGRLCIQLIIVSWLGSLLCILSPVLLIAGLPFCGPNIIDHFFCDGFSIMQLACANTAVQQLINVIAGLTFLFGSLFFTMVSYIIIISTILSIPTANGRQKAFSTCSSHLIMVTIVYGSAIFTEMSPAINPSAEVYKAVTLTSSFLSPLMNPFVYTFRNEKVKEALKRTIYQQKT